MLPLKQGWIGVVQQAQRLLNIPAVDVQGIVELPFDDVANGVRTQARFGRAHIDKAHVIIAVGRSKAP